MYFSLTLDKHTKKATHQQMIATVLDITQQAVFAVIKRRDEL